MSSIEAKARQHLAQAESALMSAEGLAHLHDGLACLETLIDAADGGHNVTRNVARNIGQTYTDRIYRRIGATLDSDPALTEPVLEHLFAVVRAFDDAGFELPAGARELKIGVVRRLVDLYYEGYPPAEREKIYRQLEALSDQSG